MNKIMTITLICSALFLASCQEKNTKLSTETSAEALIPPANTSGRIVDAGCGMCTYGIEGIKRCETWVNIDNKKLKVTGVDHNTHKSGLCKSGKHQAKVTGSIQGDKFVASSLEVVKESAGAEDHSDHDHEGHEH